MDELEARRLVHTRSGGVCERCDQARATDWSHRIARGRGGEWSPSNGIDLCRGCHAWAHANPLDASWAGIFVGTNLATVSTVVRLRYGWVYLLDDGTMKPYEPPLGLPADVLDALDSVSWDGES